MKGKRLSPAERTFFRLVGRAAFSNPFSEERHELDCAIAGREGPWGSNLVRTAARRVDERLGELDRGRPATLAEYSGEDRDLLAVAFLHSAYHRQVDPLDDLILSQIQEGDAPCPAPFGSEAVAMLRARGFTRDEALLYLGMFYQLRRAYYFVDRTLIGRSPCMRQLRKRLWNNIFTSDTRWYAQHLWNRMEDYSTLLLGETGSGKGAVAASIGRSGFIPFDEKRARFSESFTHSFICINLSQYPEALIESELFGHRKGAFTGAIEHHEGILSHCSPHGAIFLDEIGDVSVPVQIKLLQVLEERFFSPVGSHERRRFHGRIIAATHRHLPQLRREERFRNDFFYRLCSDCIEVPPLRQRIREDPRELDDMLAHIVQRLVGAETQDLAVLAREAIEESLGLGYPWPGNVRELEQAVRRIILNRRYEGEPAPEAQEGPEALADRIAAGHLTAESLVDEYCALLYRQLGTYSEVARVTALDRRTVKKRVERVASL